MGAESKLSTAGRLAGILALIGLAVLAPVLCYARLEGTYTNSAKPVDVDGDGDLDVMLQNVRKEGEFTAFSAVTLWINQGEGHFVAARPLESPGAEAGWASAAGDVDGDGHPDLVTFNGWSLRFLLPTGPSRGGWSQESWGTQIVNAPRRDAQYGSILLGDLNNDSRLDALVTGCCGRIFSQDHDDDRPNLSWVWFNEPDSYGRLSAHSYLLPALDGLAIPGAALGDLDGDGDEDIFAAVIAPREGRNTDPADRVLFNDGQGRFNDSGQRLGATDSTTVALGDLDGDGDLDALVGTGRGATVWINQGGEQGGPGGWFAQTEQTIPTHQTNAVFLSDMDGDGALDAVLAGNRQATIWLNQGQGVFAQSRQSFPYSRRHAVAVEDFDGDGWPDIFAAEYDLDYQVWSNQGNGSFLPEP